MSSLSCDRQQSLGELRKLLLAPVQEGRWAFHQLLLHRLDYLLMIASYTAPSALVQTVRPCKGTWILWSDGVVHGA